MNRWIKGAVALVAVFAVAGGITVIDGGGFISNGRTWADGPASSVTSR